MPRVKIRRPARDAPADPREVVVVHSGGRGVSALYPGRVDPDTRARLEENGFRWFPRHRRWGR